MGSPPKMEKKRIYLMPDDFEGFFVTRRRKQLWLMTATAPGIDGAARSDTPARCSENGVYVGGELKVQMPSERKEEVGPRLISTGELRVEALFRSWAIGLPTY